MQLSIVECKAHVSKPQLICLLSRDTEILTPFYTDEVPAVCLQCSIQTVNLYLQRLLSLNTCQLLHSLSHSAKCHLAYANLFVPQVNLGHSEPS